MKSRHEYIQFLHRKIDEWNLEIDRLVGLKDHCILIEISSAHYQ